MLIEEKPLQHWMNHFYGYGSWKAAVWFVGHEESGGDLPEDVAEKLNYFYATHPAAVPTLCDIRETYHQILFRVEGPRAEKFTNLYDHRFGRQAVLHGAWKNLIAFTHGCQNKELPDLLSYQQQTFAQINGQREALIQLYPLPSTHNHAWYYSWLDQPGLPFLKSRARYESHVYPSRIQTILQQISMHQPSVVVMYGMENIAVLKNSVQDFFPGTHFKSMKGSKLHIPQHHRASLSNTELVITTQVPTLRHNRAETGFDWYAFGKSIQC